MSDRPEDKDQDQKAQQNKLQREESYTHLRSISTATLLEESSHLKLVLRGVIAISIIILLLVIWATFTTIQETAVTYGELVPKGQVQVVQHLEGGIISQVHVRDGETVKKRSILVTLDPTAVRTELLQLRSQEVALILDEQRLKAYLANKSPEAVNWVNPVVQSKYNPVKNEEEIMQLIKDEKALLDSQLKKQKDQENILNTSIARSKEKLNEAMNQKKVWERHVDLLTQQFNMYQKLRDKNLIAHKDYLTILREMNRARGENVRLESEIEQLKKSIEEEQGKFQELESSLREQALKELGEVSNNLLETRHKIERLIDRLTRLKVKAPVTGIVKGLRVYPGNVVQPGGVLLEIVPYGEELVAETKIQPRDIGFIKVGDPVTVKILTYDYARYGSIKGEVEKISATTFLDADKKPYYKAMIKLSQQYLGSGGKEKRLLPGMTVEANVLTGEKTLLQYLFKPIQRTAGEAFRER